MYEIFADPMDQHFIFIGADDYFSGYPYGQTLPGPAPVPDLAGCLRSQRWSGLIAHCLFTYDLTDGYSEWLLAYSLHVADSIADAVTHLRDLDGEHSLSAAMKGLISAELGGYPVADLDDLQAAEAAEAITVEKLRELVYPAAEAIRCTFQETATGERAAWLAQRHGEGSGGEQETETVEQAVTHPPIEAWTWGLGLAGSDDAGELKDSSKLQDLGLWDDLDQILYSARWEHRGGSALPADKKWISVEFFPADDSGRGDIAVIRVDLDDEDLRKKINASNRAALGQSK